MAEGMSLVDGVVGMALLHTACFVFGEGGDDASSNGEHDEQLLQTRLFFVSSNSPLNLKSVEKQMCALVSFILFLLLCCNAL